MAWVLSFVYELALFSILLIAGHVLLMHVFRLTTYHRYFLRASPLLVVLAGAIAFLLWYLGLDGFFIWYLVMESLWLGHVYRVNVRSAAAVVGTAEGEHDLAMRVRSTMSTAVCFVLSAIVFLLTIAVVYVYLYNRAKL